MCNVSLSGQACIQTSFFGWLAVHPTVFSQTFLTARSGMVYLSGENFQKRSLHHRRSDILNLTHWHAGDLRFSHIWRGAGREVGRGVGCRFGGLTWSPRSDSFPWRFALCSLWWAGRVQASCCIWCSSRCSHENLLSKTGRAHPSVQHNYLGLALIWGRGKKKAYARMELVSTQERSRGGRLSRWSCLHEWRWEEQDLAALYLTRVYMRELRLMFCHLWLLNWGQEAHCYITGSQSCRVCTLMPLRTVAHRARFCTWVCERLTVDLVHRCVVFLLSPWALIYIYAIWVNNRAAKFSI